MVTAPMILVDVILSEAVANLLSFIASKEVTLLKECFKDTYIMCYIIILIEIYP